MIIVDSLSCVLYDVRKGVILSKLHTLYKSSHPFDLEKQFEFNAKIVKCIKQMNAHDCGFFSLTFLQCFYKTINSINEERLRDFDYVFEEYQKELLLLNLNDVTTIKNKYRTYKITL